MKSGPTSDVYEYNINTNTIKKLYESAGKSDGPIGRSGCGCSYDGKKFVYIFGGKAETRLNDLWRFNL
jgi:N-acetylneuraminic acid mutarotase